MSKNIFLYNKPSTSQNDLQVNNLTVNQQLKLNGADPNELLITDADSNVVTFNNGPDRYLLEIDAATHTPKWTNNISIDAVTTNELRINNLQTGDLLVANEGPSVDGYLERLPIGFNDTVLSTNTISGFPLQYRYIPDILNLPTGPIFSLAGSSNQFYVHRNHYDISPNPVTFQGSTVLFQTVYNNAFQSANYKITITFINLINGGGTNIYSLVIPGIGTLLTYTTTQVDGFEVIVQPYNQPFNGAVTIQLVGAHVGGAGDSSGTVNQQTILVEPLGFP